MTTVDQDAQTVLSSSAGLYVEAGKFFASMKAFTFSFTFRDSFYIDLSIPVTILLGTIPLKLDFTSNLIYTPQMYTWGASWRPTPDLLLAVDLTYNIWSDFLSPSLNIDTDIQLPILPLKLLPGKVENPDFSNTVTTRIGGEYRALKFAWGDFILRGGYAFDPSPVPEQTGWSNFMDGDKHIFSAGLGFEHQLVGEDQSRTTLGVQTVFQLQWLEETHHTKDQTADIPRFYINPGYPEISGEGRVYFFGVAFTVEYGGS
jgi:long-chain fatty acid transport protein